MSIKDLFQPPMSIRELQNSPFDFYLTGSRAFGKETASSDWDFFVQDSEAVRQFLKDKGYLQEGNSLYIDDLYTVVVMRRLFVHVQLVKDVDIKILAQELVANWPGFKEPISKDTEKLIWRACYDFILRVREHDNKKTQGMNKQPSRKIEWTGA